MHSSVFSVGQIIPSASHWEKPISSPVAEFGETATKINSHDYSSNNGY